MIGLLRERNFALLWTAALLSMLGSWVRFAALPIWVYETTGSATATGAMFVASALPMLLLGSVAGVFVDRWDRKRTMVVADVLRGLILLPLLLVPATGWIWVVYLVAFAGETASRFADPAFNATLPRVVGSDRLLQANSASAIGQNVARLVGPPLGGMLMVLFGLEAVVLVDSASFFLSGALVALVVVPRSERAEAMADSAAARWRQIWIDWLAGLRLIAGERWLRVVFAAIAVNQFAEGVLGVAYVVWVSELLGGGAREVGLLLGAQAVGSIVGAPIVARLGGRIAPGRLIGIGGLCLGLYWTLMIAYRDLTTALVLMAVVGVPVIGFGVALTTLLQGGVPDEYRGRVWGAFMTTMALTGLLGRGFVTLFGDALGVVALLAVVAAFDALAGLVALILLRGTVRPRPAAVASAA